MMLPGREVLIGMTDGDSIRGTTRWSWRWLRIGRVRSSPSAAEPDVLGVLVLPPHAVLSIQYLPKGART